ncbi:hypothetical protein [Tenacibaculum amylolyticum]|uniref:hypothetical protein n=1 Tax=Tenacibaculum amylolyticum TaxID=104269 RepID=UPI003895BB5B
MKFIKIVLVTFLFIVLNSCTKENDERIAIDSSNLLLGNWVMTKYENEKLIFQRATQLEENTYGISFFEDKRFIERTSGFCGTPPLSFFNLEGTYVVAKTLIKLQKENDPNSLLWRIISLTNEELVVTYEQTDQEKDYQELMELFEEIYTIATSKTCEDANNWSFTTYGSKACGGYQGFIAYPKTINVNEFLEKVAIYTQKEEEYNIKWDIISTCELPAQPTEVVCENGKPVFKY